MSTLTETRVPTSEELVARVHAHAKKAHAVIVEQGAVALDRLNDGPADLVGGGDVEAEHDVAAGGRVERIVGVAGAALMEPGRGIAHSEGGIGFGSGVHGSFLDGRRA